MKKEKYFTGYCRKTGEVIGGKKMKKFLIILAVVCVITVGFYCCCKLFDEDLIIRCPIYADYTIMVT